MNRFITAIASRNNADTSVPMKLPVACSVDIRDSSAIAVTAMATDASTTTVEWPSEKTKPEPVREQRRPEQQRIRVKRRERPGPRRQVEDDEQGVDADDAAAHLGRVIGKETPQVVQHATSAA